MSAWLDYAYHKFAQYKQRGNIQIPVIIGVVIILVIGFFVFLQPKNKPADSVNSPPPNQAEMFSSAKGVVIVKSPNKGEKIKSPLTVTGFVYGNNGILTVKLKQKESGQYVTEDKIVKIEGISDKISFAETIQFGLPVMPQTGVLEIEYKDKSGKGLSDRVDIEVEFPSDLGKGT